MMLSLPRGRAEEVKAEGEAAMWDEITGSKNPNERSNPNVHRWRNSSRKMRYMHEIDYYPVFKRNRILMNAPTWMNLYAKGEQNRHERTNTCRVPLYEVSK